MERNSHVIDMKLSSLKSWVHGIPLLRDIMEVQLTLHSKTIGGINKWRKKMM